MEEGFRLTHKKSLSENSICFRYQHHSCYGKDTSLNSDCQFKVCIYKKRDTNFYHVTSYYSGISLFSYQLRNTCKSSKVSTTSTESEELINYVNSNKGLAIPFETPDEDGIIHRHGVATFNETELSNYDKCGDFIAFKPTFTPMISNWNNAPIGIMLQ